MIFTKNGRWSQLFFRHLIIPSIIYQGLDLIPFFCAIIGVYFAAVYVE